MDWFFDMAFSKQLVFIFFGIFCFYKFFTKGGKGSSSSSTPKEK